MPPENVTILPNHGFAMNCLASSFGLLEYDWNRRNGKIPSTAVKSCTRNILFNPPDKETTDVCSLAVPNAQPSDEGWYCCVATNEGGSTVDCAWLEINSKLQYALLSCIDMTAVYVIMEILNGIIYSQGLHQLTE